MKTESRLKFLRIAICAGFLAGIFASFELWFPVHRAFPRAPMFFDLPENSIVFFERLFSLLLVASLVTIIFWQRRKIFFILAAVSLILLVIFDQTRLQPWVYQYFLLLVVLALSENEDETASNQTLALVQILIAALYFWSGAQKLNYTFLHETLPLLLAPVQNIFPSVQPPFAFLGFAVALFEIFTGIGLLFRKTRAAAVYLAAAAHLVILALLIAKNYNQIVWIWNAALIALVVLSFWKSDVSIKQTFLETAKLKFSTIIVAASILLPALSFFGLWDMYLSGALYSGNTEVGVVRVNENLFGKLPPAAKGVVFQTKTGEKILPLFEWAIAEMNVPVYPESRVFKKVARVVCRSAGDKASVELIIKERPAITDGSYKLARTGCAELEKY